MLSEEDQARAVEEALGGMTGRIEFRRNGQVVHVIPLNVALSYRSDGYAQFSISEPCVFSADTHGPCDEQRFYVDGVSFPVTKWNRLVQPGDTLNIR